LRFGDRRLSDLLLRMLHVSVQETVFPYAASQQCCLNSTWLSTNPRI
jgi:hypothetical protein